MNRYIFVDSQMTQYWPQYTQVNNSSNADMPYSTYWEYGKTSQKNYHNTTQLFEFTNLNIYYTLNLSK